MSTKNPPYKDTREAIVDLVMVCTNLLECVTLAMRRDESGDSGDEHPNDAFEYAANNAAAALRSILERLPDDG